MIRTLGLLFTSPAGTEKHFSESGMILILELRLESTTNRSQLIGALACKNVPGVAKTRNKVCTLRICPQVGVMLPETVGWRPSIGPNNNVVDQCHSQQFAGL